MNGGLSALLGTPVVMSPGLPDGTVMSASRPWARILIGTGKLPEHRAEARQIVRDGLADVLAWLGEPRVTPTGEEIWARLTKAVVTEGNGGRFVP